MSTKQQRKFVKRNQADEVQQEQEDFLEVDLYDVRSKTERFVEDNWLMLALGALAIVLLVGGIYYYNSVYQPAQVKEANNSMFVAQGFFKENKFREALDGDGSNDGFLQIIDSYGGKAGNLASYYAGICHLNLGEFEDAIDKLSGFSSSDVILSAMAKGAIGDANAELGKLDEAISNYRSAAKTNPNELSSPYYLMKAGVALESQGKHAEALELYKEIKAKYPESAQGRDADKLIVRAQAKS